MNLSFHKNNWGPGPQLTMGATPMVATHLVLDGPYAFLAIHQIQFLNDLIKAKEQGAWIIIEVTFYYKIIYFVE